MGWSVREQDGRAVTEVWRENDETGLYKAYLRGTAGRFLLGTLTPEGGRLVIRRSVSIERLLFCGSWPVVAADCKLEFAFPPQDPPDDGWQRLEAEGKLADPVLREAALTSGSAWIAAAPHGFCLSYAFQENKPFPMTPLFCFAKLTPFRRGTRAVFYFAEDGTPLMEQPDGRGPAL